MIRQTYDNLKKDHPLLPDFDKLDNEFEVSTIDSELFLLRSIKRKIGEKLEPILEMLERIINPDPNSFSDLCECRTFTGGEKKQIVDIFRKLMQDYRLLLETELACEAKVDVETIKKVHESWSAERRQLIPFIRKIRESWQKPVEPKEILDYLG